MFDAIKRLALVKLALRAIRAHERLADAVCDIRDHLCGGSRVAVNRDARSIEADPTADFISYADDASTWEREVAAEARAGRFGRGNQGPF